MLDKVGLLGPEINNASGPSISVTYNVEDNDPAHNIAEASECVT